MNDTENLNPPAVLAAILADTSVLDFQMLSEPLMGALLRSLCASKPGGRFLELGTGTGAATAWMLDGMDAQSTLWTVDCEAGLVAIAQAHLAADPRVSFFVQDGGQFLESLAQQGESFDLIFADTWPGKYTHLDLALSLVKPGGLYLIDDMLPQANWPEGHAPKVDALIADLEQRNEWAIAKLAWASGILLATRRSRLSVNP
ncbi:O-methyltransferase [Thermoleptolyngbya sp. M55_K2018_002]|uniref:O-methyltransferase n=1 Tax=Thermoleptolyngbya sp. M55_K2018_002 TaxID=2747808 RepID=UPI0019E20BD9|nr:class I SAM-dependent methyltransferase [Thermoleptolyngbya sp. M55_K2018_002]HIK40132.1 class I SAM-dependent methyltransferase [Thermoleptolyngbya sp. M55_K2018_002]